MAGSLASRITRELGTGPQVLNWRCEEDFSTSSGFFYFPAEFTDSEIHFR